MTNLVIITRGREDQIPCGHTLLAPRSEGMRNFRRGKEGLDSRSIFSDAIGTGKGPLARESEAIGRPYTAPSSNILEGGRMSLQQ